MTTLPFKAIKTQRQYFKYCNMLEELVFKKKNTKNDRDIIDLLTVLIEHYDNEHNTFEDADPVELLQSLMEDHKMKSVDMAKMLGISKSLMSDILNYRRGMSKEVVRKLAERFKMRQEAFNRSYNIFSPSSGKVKKATAK